MTVSLSELVESRQSSTGENGQTELVYVLTGTDDEVTARTLVTDSTATTYDGKTRQSIALKPITVDTASGTGTWEATVRYGMAPAAPETGQSTTSFDTSGGTQHITQSIKNVSKTANPAWTIPDCHGAINVGYGPDGRPSVAGVDIVVPVYAWMETHYISDDDVQSHKAAYYNLTGKVCNGAFRTFAAGEVLCRGVQGSRRGNSDWEITFHFAASPNKTNIAIGADATHPGGLFTVASKKGWEYLWIMYFEDADTAAYRLTKVPVGAYVEQVYDEGDMSSLGIGT